MEVIVGNDGAQKIYEKAGFAIARRLDCYKGTLTYEPLENILIEEIKEPHFEYLKTFHSITPSWQNTPAAIMRDRQQHKLWGVKKDGEWIAYAAIAPAAGRLNYWLCCLPTGGRALAVLYSTLLLPNLSPVL